MALFSVRHACVSPMPVPMFSPGWHENSRRLPFAGNAHQRRYRSERMVKRSRIFFFFQSSEVAVAFSAIARIGSRHAESHHYNESRTAFFFAH